jgi:phage gp45-like
VSFHDDKHTARLMNTRGQLIELDDSGEIQLVKAHGLYGEKMSDVHRVQGFGLSSTPPEGSHGLLQAVGGRRDQVVVMGMEHPDHRPRDISPGETILYNAHGDTVSIIKQNIRIKSARVDVNPP